MLCPGARDRVRVRNSRGGRRGSDSAAGVVMTATASPVRSRWQQRARSASCSRWRPPCHETGCSEGNSSTRLDGGRASRPEDSESEATKEATSRTLLCRSAALAWIARMGRPVSLRKAASTSAREEPQSPTACAQSTPSARADDNSPNAAHRDNVDSEADALIRDYYPDIRLRVPSNPRSRQTK